MDNREISTAIKKISNFTYGNREVSGFDSLIEYGNSFIKNCRKNNSFSDGLKKHSSLTKCPNKDKFYKRSEEKSTVSLNHQFH